MGVHSRFVPSFALVSAPTSRVGTVISTVLAHGCRGTGCLDLRLLRVAASPDGLQTRRSSRGVLAAASPSLPGPRCTYLQPIIEAPASGGVPQLLCRSGSVEQRSGDERPTELRKEKASRVDDVQWTPRKPTTTLSSTTRLRARLRGRKEQLNEGGAATGGSSDWGESARGGVWRRWRGRAGRGRRSW